MKKKNTWDIYSYKVRPGFKASNDPIERDLLHAAGLGITNWSQADTDLAEVQAQLGRDYATSAAVAEKNAPSCDCVAGCAKCGNEHFYRPQGARTGRFSSANAMAGIVDYDAIVCREEGFYVLIPQSIRAREFFSIYYAEKQTANGRFIFNSDSDVIQLAQKSKDTGANLSFGKGY